MYKFTIFTSTYNSENVIHRVFESVLQQEYTNFEWIIIDDFSKDNTVNLIERFIEDNKHIDIRFFKNTENRGVAYNRKKAIYLSDTKYFITWDHDDIQHLDQLSTYNQIWSQYEEDSVANIFAKIEDQNGNLLGQPFPQDVFISNYIDIHNEYLVGSYENDSIVEHHVCVKTDIYKKIIEYYEENNQLLKDNLPNGADIWGMISYLGYKTIFINNKLRTYFVKEEGRITMSSGARTDNPQKIYLHKLLWVNYFDPKMSHLDIVKNLKNIFAVAMYGSLSGYGLMEIIIHIKSDSKRIICIIIYLPALILAAKYKSRISIFKDY